MVTTHGIFALPLRNGGNASMRTHLTWLAQSSPLSSPIRGRGTYIRMRSLVRRRLPSPS